MVTLTLVKFACFCRCWIWLQVYNQKVALSYSHELFNIQRQQAETYCRLYGGKDFHNERQSLTSVFKVQGVTTKEQDTLISGFKPWATFTAEQSEYKILFWHRLAWGFEVAIIIKLNYIFSMIHGGSIAIPLCWIFNRSMQYLGKNTWNYGFVYQPPTWSTALTCCYITLSSKKAQNKTNNSPSVN